MRRTISELSSRPLLPKLIPEAIAMPLASRLIKREVGDRRVDDKIYANADTRAVLQTPAKL